MFRRSFYILALVVVFIVGVFLGNARFFIKDWYPGYFLAKITSQQSGSTDVSEQDTNYQFVNPLLFCQDQNISGFTDATIQKMQNEVEQYISDETKKGDVTDVGVYYKDLNNGPNFSTNSSLLFAPASLLKVPTAISVFKHAESDPNFLNKVIPYVGGELSNSTQYFAPKESIQIGNSYSVKDLLKYMLQDSDNAALSLLGGQLDAQELSQSYSDIGVAVPSAPQPAYTVSVKTYASFFRVLFNASYMKREYSEMMLSILAGTQFDEGLVAGVPKGTLVAHKFGEYTISPGKNQLHDCGIIYKLHEPYLLCVMTRGSDYNTLARIIAHISDTVYTALVR